jgi:hypothetical protein
MANLVLFALTRRESSASPAGRNSRSSRPIHRRQTGPGFSIIRKSPLLPQRWHAHSLFSGSTTTSSGARLACSIRRSRFFSGSFGETQWGAISRFDRRLSASTESQRLALRRTRYIVCLVRRQASFGRPGLQQRQGFQYPRQAGLHGALDAVDLAPPPTLHRAGVEPPDPGHHVDRAHIPLRSKRRPGSPGDAIGECLPFRHQITKNPCVASRRSCSTRPYSQSR